LQVSAEQFNQIVAECRRQAGEGQGDKRQSARAGVRYTATVRPTIPNVNAPGTPFTARIRNISGGGVALVCPTQITGAFTLEIPDARGVAQVVRCTVTYSRKIDKDQFHVGGAFVE
jgi:hypothetical protein